MPKSSLIMKYLSFIIFIVDNLLYDTFPLVFPVDYRDMHGWILRQVTGNHPFFKITHCQLWIFIKAI